MSTYLSTTPSFTSPQPLAASSGLTIPLQITLSDIRLSAFIILVFSRQKGLTLVFRNDPLESLKVSSTFDSIPFVRDYLQKEIEGQLRTLLMDEVPVIIHRLSLQWVPEYGGRAEQEMAKRTKAAADEDYITDPLASPPQDAVDSSGRPLDASQIASLALDSNTESHALFSQRTLLKLAALNDSHRTLSLFTPGMKDVVFRASPGQAEHGEKPGPMTSRASLPGELSRNQFHRPNMNTLHSHHDYPEKLSASRPTLLSHGSAGSTLQLGRHTKPGRRKKHRVVNLRRTKTGLEDTGSISGEGSTSTAASVPGSEASVPLSDRSIPEEQEGELTTPPNSPDRHPHVKKTQGNGNGCEKSSSKDPDVTQRQSTMLQAQQKAFDATWLFPPPFNFQSSESFKGQQRRPEGHVIRPSRYFTSFKYPSDKPSNAGLSASTSIQSPLPSASTSTVLDPPFPYLESSAGGILEQAWIMKMAGMIAKRVQEEKFTGDLDFKEMNQGQRADTFPPAYGL